MEWPEVFLSSAINYQPASSIGTLGLTMAIYMLPPVAFVRYCMIEDRTEGLVMNKVALGCSLLSSFGALLVAAFQASSQIDVHLTGAGIFFAFSLFLVLSQSYLDFRTRSIAPLNTGAYLRLLLAVAAVGSLGALAMYGLIILVKYARAAASSLRSSRESHLPFLFAHPPGLTRQVRQGQLPPLFPRPDVRARAHVLRRLHARVRDLRAGHGGVAPAHLGGQDIGPEPERRGRAADERRGLRE